MSTDARQAGGTHAHRVARRLEARGLPGLAEALSRLEGIDVGGRWRIDSLYAVGAEGAVYFASALRGGFPQPCAIKVPLLPYHRPADVSSRLLRHRRDSLRQEADCLERSSSPYMPAYLGLHEIDNPLIDRARGGPFAEREPVLVMERLPGLDVDLWLARVHRSAIPRELLRQHLDRIAVVLLQALFDLQERGFIYADLRPGNLRMIGRPQRRIRLLDAGSLVEVGDASGRYPHVPHYLPPALFEQRYGQGLAITPSPEAQAVMAGRTLFEVATGIVPVPGHPLDAAALKEGGVSPPVADVVDGLATGSFQNVVYALRYLSRRAVRRVVTDTIAGAPVAPALPPVETPAMPATKSHAPAAHAAQTRTPVHAVAAPTPSRGRAARFFGALARFFGRGRAGG